MGDPIWSMIEMLSMPHVYARDVREHDGRCRCGQMVGNSIHTEAAPGVPVPPRLRPGFGIRLEQLPNNPIALHLQVPIGLFLDPEISMVDVTQHLIDILNVEAQKLQRQINFPNN